MFAMAVAAGLIAAMGVAVPANAATSVTPNEDNCYNTTNRVKLTFDDEGDPPDVNALLTILRQKNVRAGFGPVGYWANENPALVRRMRAEGHWLFNHSYNHPDLTTLSPSEIRSQIVHGVRSTLLRPPLGNVDGKVRSVAASLGYRICLWNVDSNDWRGRSAKQITKKVVGQAAPGDVVLLHMLPNLHTREALPGLIDDLRAKGLTLDPLR